MKTLLQQFKTLFIGLTMMGALAVNAQDLDGDAPAGAQIEPVTVTFTSSSTVKIQKWHSTHSPGDNVSVGGEVYDFSIRTITSTESVDLKANGYCDEFVVREGNVTHIQANGVDVVQGNNVMIEGTTYSSFTLPTSILEAQPWGRESSDKTDLDPTCHFTDMYLGPGAYQIITLKGGVIYDFEWTNHNTSKVIVTQFDANDEEQEAFTVTTNGLMQWDAGSADEVKLKVWAVRDNCVWDGNGASLKYKMANYTVNNPAEAVQTCTLSPFDPIVHATTGVTGIGAASGLPGGVTAAFENGQVVISGMSVETGTFNYTVELESELCGNAVAEGTIVVSDGPAVSVEKIGDNIIEATASGVTYQWVNCDSGDILPGQTNDVLIATESGSYAVIVTDANGCSSVSDCIAVSTSSIKNEVFNALSVYPNPVKDVVTIDFGNTIDKATVTVMDLTGKSLQTQVLTNTNQYKLSVDSYANGVYLVEIKADNQKQVIKIVKE